MKKIVEPIEQTTIGMYDKSLVENITIGVTINLLGYEFLKVDVSGTDPENNRRALIETLTTIIPAQNAVRRECINKYVNEVLVKPHIITPVPKQ